MQIKDRFASTSDHVNMLRSMIVRIDDEPKPAQSKYCGHTQILAQS